MDKLIIIKNAGPFKKPDIMICVLTVALIISALFFFMPKNKGNYAEIYCGNNLVKTMYLDSDAVYRYEYEGHYNIITVKDGKISVTESDCADKICQSYAPSDIAGSVIICLPHNLLIIIKGEGGLDGVVNYKQGGVL